MKWSQDSPTRIVELCCSYAITWLHSRLEYEYDNEDTARDRISSPLSVGDLQCLWVVMQNYYNDPPGTSRKGSDSSRNDFPAPLPYVSFSSQSGGRTSATGGGNGFGGHERECPVESGVYMITMASGAENDTQVASILASTKTVASVTPSAVSQKTTKKLIFQLDDQRDTFDSEEKVYP